MKSKNSYKGINLIIVRYVRYYAKCIKRLKCFADESIEDVEQELFCMIWPGVKKYDESKSSFSTFVCQLVKCRSINLIRKKLCKKCGGRDGVLYIDSIILDNITDEKCRFEDEITTRIDVNDIISTLPKEWQILCNQLAVLNITEIAEINGVPRTTIYYTLQRIKRCIQFFFSKSNNKQLSRYNPYRRITNMTLKIINNDERIKMATGVKIVIFGPYGIGKTSLLKTLDERALCLDFEAGLLAVQDWNGDSISTRTWNEARDIACLIGGPNPALKADQAYSQRHYEHVSSKYKELSLELSKYQCIFIDSITVASRLCLLWAKLQPESISERTGKQDMRAAYGILAQEMMAWLSQFQHILDKDIILVGTLGQYLDDFNRPNWLPQCEGAKTASEIPGIVDEVISMVGIKKEDGTEMRSFVCHAINNWGYPAKDRSGCLNMVEEPHLGKLLTKIKNKTSIHFKNSISKGA